MGGNGILFKLSQQFLHNVTRSSFPPTTGKIAARFSHWLYITKEKTISWKREYRLKADLQCGDIFQLFGLVSSGELSISPCVPKEGVGEADDLRNLKRKADVDDNCTVDSAKKLKSSTDGELVSDEKRDSLI